MPVVLFSFMLCFLSVSFSWFIDSTGNRNALSPMTRRLATGLDWGTGSPAFSVTTQSQTTSWLGISLTGSVSWPETARPSIPCQRLKWRRWFPAPSLSHQSLWREILLTNKQWANGLQTETLSLEETNDQSQSGLTGALISFDEEDKNYPLLSCYSLVITIIMTANTSAWQRNSCVSRIPSAFPTALTCSSCCSFIGRKTVIEQRVGTSCFEIRDAINLLFSACSSLPAQWS